MLCGRRTEVTTGRLAQGGRFLGASHGAYSDGISGLAKVGPPSASHV